MEYKKRKKNVKLIQTNIRHYYYSFSSGFFRCFLIIEVGLAVVVVKIYKKKP